MREIIIILFIQFLFLNLVLGQSGIMNHQLSIKENQTSEQFANSFPYDSYLKNIDFTDIQTLQKDRELMRIEKGNGDLFLYYLTQKFIESYPVTIDELEDKASVGESFLNPMTGDWNRDIIYNTIGYYILGKVASKIEDGIKKKKISFTDPEIKNLEARLYHHKVVLDIEETTQQKIIKNIKQAKFKYLFNRLGLRINEYLNPIACRINLSGKMIGLTACLIFILTLLSRKKILIGLFSILVVVLIILAKVLPSCTQSINTSNPQNNFHETKIKLKPIIAYHKIDKSEDHSIKIFNLNESDKTVGECIWMEMPYVKANYFSYGDAYNKLNDLKENRQVVFASTGGYTNKNFPVGLTIDDGVIVNASIKHNMDGLLVVSNMGETVLLNLDNKTLQLPFEGPQIENPLDNLIAFSELLKWATDKKVTLFQSQIFAANDEIAMSPTRSDSRIRERRLLTLCTDITTDKKYHIIFNLRSSYTQYDATQEVLSITKNNQLKVEGIINLDTGTFNIMHIYDNNGKVIKSAPNDIKKAANLLVFSI